MDLWSVLLDRLHGRRKQTSTARTALALTIGSLNGTTPGIATGPNTFSVILERPDENIPLLRALLDHGANPNILIDGDTPLNVAITLGKSATVLLLLQYKADVHRGVDPFNNIITGAFYYRDSRIITAILDRFSLRELNRHPTYNITLLMDAASDGNVEAVRALLDRHVDINVRSPDGATAFSLAERANRQVKHMDKVAVIKMLKSAGEKE